MKKSRTDNFTRREFIRKAGSFAGGSEFASLMLSAPCDQPDDATTSSGSVSSAASGTVLAEAEADPAVLKYSPEHIWIKDEGDNNIRIGITQKLFNMMTNQGKVLFSNVTLPEAGDRVTRGQTFGVLESSKMSLELLSPVSGEVLQNNTALARNNNNVYGKAWLLLIKMSHHEELNSLLSYTEYLALTGQIA